VTAFTVRQAQRPDLDAYLDIQRESWDDMAATEEQLRSRFDMHLEGILVAESSGEVVGAVTLIRLADYSSDQPLSWDEATGCGWCTTHVPDGPVVFGVDLSSKGAPKAVPALIEAAVGFVSAAGAVNLTWGGRMPGFAKYRSAHPGISADEYLQLKTPAGRRLDWQVRMYSEVFPGVEVVRAVPDYFDDPESGNYGVMLRIPNPSLPEAD
jgi:hypothetical protein